VTGDGFPTVVKSANLGNYMGARLSHMGEAGPLAVRVTGNSLRNMAHLPLILSFSRNLALARLPLRVAISASGYGRGEGTLLRLFCSEQ
jgi:hypothetical protein